MPGQKPLSYLLIITAGIAWGGSFSLIILAVQGGTPPVTLVAIQVLISALLFIPLGLFTRTTVFRLCHLPQYILVSIVGIVLPSVLYYLAAPHLSAGILSITVSTVPMLTYALMVPLKLEPWKIKRALGIVLGMAAILLLILPETALDEVNASFWILVVLICALCYALESVYIDAWLPPRVEVRELLCGSNLLAAVVLIPATAWSGDFVTMAWFNTTAFWAVVGIAVTNLVAYMMYFYTIKLSGAVFASQVAYIVTVAGVLWGIVLFAERHTLWVWLSVVVMVLGLVLVTPRIRILDVLEGDHPADPQRQIP